MSDSEPIDIQKKSNQAWWNERSPMHVESQFYDIQNFINGDIRLNDYEVSEIGEINNKKILHLQCHLGIESIDLARLGGSVSALDFSSTAIESAKRIAESCGQVIDFRVGDVYDANKIFDNDTFDIVYISIGSLHWLPDIFKWGQVVSQLLNEGGIVYINEIHPFSSILGDSEDTAMTVSYDYFNRTAVKWEDSGSYADTPTTTNDTHYIYDRPLSDIFNALIDAGLHITLFNERPNQEFQQFIFQEKDEDGRWKNPNGYGVFPSTFSLRAVKPTKMHHE